MKLLATIILSLSLLSAAHAQYAPQAGISGSTAIPAASPLFTGWATACTVQRGYIDIADPNAGYVMSGNDVNAVGAADQTTVSLGDSGVAVLTFATPLYDGPGADFAIFENGFADPNDPQSAFLELAFVEVSSDGVNYFRFPAHSLTPPPQVPGAGTYMNAAYINNLAGKYISGYGTPFDLGDLSGIGGLNVQHITHVRLVDVIGSLSSLHGSADTAGNIINDPYPTNFPTGGFDLNAVGAIHQYGVGVVEIAKELFNIYPNPVADRLYITNNRGQISLTLTDITGKVLLAKAVTGDSDIDMRTYQTGIYYLQLHDENGGTWVEKIVKH